MVSATGILSSPTVKILVVQQGIFLKTVYFYLLSSIAFFDLKFHGFFSKIFLKNVMNMCK